ncbi:MAG: hypothetical protein KDE50_00880 [Caldilineaceae bacterium]|nr:hypothetical protein [Caldilineaceae bacterium]MCB0138440.1 hypothetical protein [Caldilineaceae bacterium]
MIPSTEMAALATELMDKHPPTVGEYGFQLTLTQPGQGYLLIEELTPQLQMRVAYVFFDRHGEPLYEPEMRFWVGEGPWIAFAIQRTSTGRQTYGHLHALTGDFEVQDAVGQQALAKYADWFAQGLRAQGWVETAYKVTDTAGRITHFPSPRLQNLIEEMADRYGLDLNDPDAYLRLEMAGRDDSLVIQRVGPHVSLARYVAKDGILAPDPDMLFRLEKPAAWPIVEVIYSWQEWSAYVGWAQQQHIPISDMSRELLWAHFAKFWAQKLTNEGWAWAATCPERNPARVSVLDPSTWPEPTEPQPDQETLEEWMYDEGGCEATDGCWIEPDSLCPHGHPSWLLALGYI